MVEKVRSQMVVEGIDLTRNPYTDEVSYYPTSDILVTVKNDDVMSKKYLQLSTAFFLD